MIKPTIIAAAVLLTASCASAMLPRMTPEQMHERAWQECIYERTDHWRSTCDGDCKNKAMLIQEWAGAHRTTMLVGWRHDQPMKLHIVPVIDGRLVIDFDGVHALRDYREQFDEVNSMARYRAAHPDTSALWRPEG